MTMNTLDSSQARPHVFISHIHEEKPVATVLKDFLQESFGQALSVFVSSDPVSIGGGRQWFDYIIQNLKGTHVLLALVSDESKRREWINFEAGFAGGVGAAVIPVGIKNFPLSKLSFPMMGFNGRSVDDIEGLVYDIGRVTGLVGEAPDRLEFLKAVRSAEDALVYKSVVLRPYLERTPQPGELELRFEIYNQGNVDIDLLHVDIALPKVLKHPAWSPFTEGARRVDMENYGGEEYTSIRLTATLDSPNRLEPVLTRSMGRVELKVLKCCLRSDFRSLHLHEQALPIFFQVHARSYDTKRESVDIADLPFGRMKPATPWA